MENKKTMTYLNSKRWYGIFNVANICFIIFCYGAGIIGCFVFLRDGDDGLGILTKILLIIAAAALIFVISKTPQHFLHFLLGTDTWNDLYSKMILILGIAGVLFVGLVIVMLIFPFNSKENEFSITGIIPAAGSSQFIQTLAALTNAPIETGDTVTPMTNGVNQFLPAVLRAMNAASTSIDFATYPWANGTFSDQVFIALIGAARRRVQVRVLFDAIGADALSQNKIASLRSAGGIVAIYHPFNIVEPFQFDTREHIRSIVIDGRIGFTGGVGIDDSWLGDSSGKSFQDMMFELRGAMAESIQNTFEDNWNDTTGEVLSGPAFYPPIAASDKNTFIGITSIPSEDYQPVRDTFMLTILSAQKNLYIVNPYIMPDKGILKALEDAARKGVDVRILSLGRKNDSPLLRMAWHIDYEQLLEAGVKIYEYQPAIIHTKFMVADGTWSLIGSANIDNRSESLNTENLMGIADPALASSLDQTYMNYLSQSKEITLADWKKQYGLFPKLYSRILLILFKQY